VHAERRSFGAEVPGVGSLRDDPQNDPRVQEIARLIDATVRRALVTIEPHELLNTGRERAALSKLLRSESGPVPGIDDGAPCERFELAVTSPWFVPSRAPAHRAGGARWPGCQRNIILPSSRLFCCLLCGFFPTPNMFRSTDCSVNFINMGACGRCTVPTLAGTIPLRLRAREPGMRSSASTVLTRLP
jgi:hypothetical protein